ncbi:transposase [Streptomyces sp. SID4946]|uniref:transposase n=1 Tax=Streptomyces sp. LamerLS-31b TaxID=1839765 RepID=UPI00081F39B4|nr:MULTISPECIES: transposase [unclassified Streptomyces]MYQ96721.1 transposase [Streptomyces sp. SID4946]SCF62080.1 Transposase DDE domain-containing protein [Streptomyces sp. LamerLS-31b]SCG01777.1 Transposase DDE domain-containing protein [Streptomyces sp. DconLS]
MTGQVVLSEGVEPVRETLALAVGEHDREGPDVSGECVEFWALGADGGAAEVAAVQCSAHDYTGPGKPRIAWNDEQARAELVDALVTDALRLLGHLPDQQLGDKAANAVGSLALVAGQDVEPAEDSDGRDGRWRITQGTAQERIVSTVDPEARHIHKTRSHRQDGYKAHLAVESETGLYTAVALRPCAGPEHHEAAVLDLLAEEDTPVDAFGDTAYSTGDARQAPAPGRAPAVPQARTAASCRPRRLHPRRLRHRHHHRDLPGRTHRAPVRPRRAAPPTQSFLQGLMHRMPSARAVHQSQGRTHPDHPDPTTTSRQPPATDPGWQANYRRWRPPVERAVAWLVHHGNQRLRYRGTIKNDTWLHTRAAALNLRRLINLGLTHTSGTWHIAPAGT